jgi:hypothetical protein
MNRIFMLSPAYCAGKRSRILLHSGAQFALAQNLRSESGAALGELFSFLSGLYFRGKLTYSSAFARPPVGVPGTVVITPSRGLMVPSDLLHLESLQEFAEVEISLSEQRFREPLVQSAQHLALQLGEDCEVILLGSIATGKYLDILASIFGDRLRFPVEFAGRGDMSRGGLLLRCVIEQRELTYVSLSGGARHGNRPPKLPKLVMKVPS